ncbi:DUF1800 domain-containing protein [Patiriisocius marinus]|uniref:DUF1800 domain-containing protein n=1 Tax=Patiriisocius marinus TaxID=1397112 RepID=A0A5J4IVY6_9FLAO|nr:DUF1800 domain-containing protein [Patiriisocius marinus]GER58472.1 hypothetical protein ULMA_05800 [Patiriisocius marinus]
MATITSPPCNTATLAPYIPSSETPWSTQRIKHVYRRLAYGANQTDIDAVLTETPLDFIENLVNNAAALPVTPPPFWAEYTVNDFTDFDTENQTYIQEWLLQTSNDTINQGLRSRLTMFWMNHFVTELEVYFYAPYQYKYYNLMQQFALGNYKEFVRAVGINSTMLLYLNGFENTSGNPNENYARELFELFTLGENNGYTQQDITETSRALTGYNHWTSPGAEITFDASTFDDGPKTVFGITDSFTYDGLIDHLFEQKETEIAQHICGKLYRYFVSNEVDTLIQEDVINVLAQTLIDNNFEMAPMFKQLFKSEHFFDDRAIGVIIKSPFDVVFTYLNESNFFYDDTMMGAINYYAGLIGQELYDPPDVSGWQRDETWINSSTLTGRWQMMEFLHNYLYDQGLEASFIDIARDLSSDSNDPFVITTAIVDFFNAKELFTTTDYDIATSVLKWEVPQNYYDDGLWNLNWDSAPYQVYLLLIHMMRMPEFQLK